MAYNPQQLNQVFTPSLTVDTLDPVQSSELSKILQGCSIVVSDVDYTLIDISKGHDTGVAAVAGCTSPELASRFSEIFHLIVEGHRRSATEPWEVRASFDEINARIEKLQAAIIPQWGLKYWSKETMLLLAAEDVGFSFSAELLQQARDAYWQTRTKNSTAYGYVQEFCEELQKNGTALDLFTSSYHIMQISPDLSLTYDSEKSKQYKLDAIKPYVPEMTKSIIIGDPVDKPSPEFFAQVLNQVKVDTEISSDQTLDFSKICVIGDSLRNDLEYLGRLGCKTVLIKHG